MDRAAWGVSGFLALTIGGAGIFTYIGLYESATDYDSKGWYLAAGGVFAAGLLVWFWFFLVWPNIMRANAWRVRTLARAEADTPARPGKQKRGLKGTGVGLGILEGL